MLSEKEKQVLDIVVDKKFIADAKSELRDAGIPLSTAYKIIERISKKGSDARVTVNQVLGYRRKSRSHFGLLDKKLRFYE